MPRKVILDVDTGIDDALAILLALRSPELEVVGITCAAGNVTLDLVVRNTLAVLEVAEADVPVAVGARKPLLGTLRTATLFHGANGMGGVELPEPRLRPIDEHAADFLTRMTREHPGEITLVPVGRLTNLALALIYDASFATNVPEMVIMGGAISTPGNATGAAEANFVGDPEAAAAVMDCGVPIRLADLGATTVTILPMDRLEPARSRPRSPVAGLALGLLDYYGPICVRAGAAGAVLHDPLAVGLAALPDLASFVPVAVHVETGGYRARGASIGNFAGVTPRFEPVDDHYDTRGLDRVPFNVAVARDVQVSRFVDLFLERLDLA